jgi:hypothetical protein
MLEQRPITQRALAATGAFVFVFGAAMAGSAFMISGGFGLGGDNERVAPTSYVDPITVQLAAWEPQGEVDYTSAVYDAYETALDDTPALYSADDLDGSGRGDTYASSETQLNREIERLYAAVQEQERASEVDQAEMEPAPAFETEPDPLPADEADTEWTDKKPT